jgi:hypothetical protein
MVKLDSDSSGLSQSDVCISPENIDREDEFSANKRLDRIFMLGTDVVGFGVLGNTRLGLKVGLKVVGTAVIGREVLGISVRGSITIDAAVGRIDG